MHFLLIGSSGRTGSLVVDEALSRGHTVTALLRNPKSLENRHGLIKVEGTPMNKEDIGKAVTATDEPPSVIISTLNARRASDSPFSKPVGPPFMMADSTANLIDAMKQHQVSKIVIMQALGVGDSFPNLIAAMRWMVRYSNLAAQYEDHDMLDREVKARGVNYVLARPARLTDGVKKPLRFYGNEGRGVGVFACVSRESVADFLVDAAEREEWNRSTPVITN
ncbi:hypothetical protein MMC21_007741 [Puttea exsequens]|nr:hypothetical protein [Puttea exsequens]